MNAALSTIYSHYLPSYTQKKLTRFDTHKRNELRSVYNAIVQLSKESPWYLLPGRELQDYAVSLKENSRELHNAIAQLGGLESDGLLAKKSAYSSNDAFVLASYIGPAKPAGNTMEFEVEVHSLASPQENMGLFLEDARVLLPSDTYSFDIAVNDMNYEFQFFIGESESNSDVQKRLAKLINGADIGLKASVVESEEKTALRLVSETSGLPEGKDYIFHINDTHTSKSSGAVAYFGLNYTTREASNANFLIDGREYTTASNHVTAHRLFELHLKNITPDGEPVRIGLKTDIDSLTDNISQLVEDYNAFVDAASAPVGKAPKNRRLLQELKEIASIYHNSFDSMGIRLEESGALHMDKELLYQTAAETTDISRTFGYIKNFTAQLLRKSSQISLNPMDYVEKTVVAYKNPGHNFANPYTTGAYSGMMFDGYC